MAAVLGLVIIGAAPLSVFASGTSENVLNENYEGTSRGIRSGKFGRSPPRYKSISPVEAGSAVVRGGTTEVGSRVVPLEIITTMTDVIRIIDGVPAIAMLDESTDSGEVAQVGFDYLALDKDGNVWILGGYTEDFQGGEYTNLDNAWLGPGRGAEVGILVPFDVDMSTRGGSSANRLTRVPRLVNRSKSVSPNVSNSGATTTYG
jgi:hypothetical protein